MNNCAYNLIGTLFISVHNRESPTDGEFPEILSTFERLDHAKVRMLVKTQGGGPTAKQRATMNKVLNGTHMPTAVISDDVLIRGTVTALSWFNSQIRAFPCAKINDALAYLDVPDTQFQLIRKEVERLEASLDKAESKRMAVGR